MDGASAIASGSRFVTFEGVPGAGLVDQGMQQLAPNFAVTSRQLSLPQ